MLYKTRGVVFKTIRFSETSVVSKIYTERFGLQSYIINGVRSAKAKVKARIVITPEHAKRLLTALNENIERYEASFGTIKQTQEFPSFPMNFSGTIGEA